LQGLESGSITGFSRTASYDLQLTVFNGNLVGQVFNSSGSLITSIQAADTAAYTSGFAGIVASREVGDPTLLGTFGSVTAVPEPSSLLAVLSVVGTFAINARYRRKRALLQRRESQ
jgi:energy-converting hydrogenase Eha subunit B